MKRIFSGIMLFLLLLATGISDAAISSEGPFRVIRDSKTINLSVGNSFELGLTIHVPEGYYIYAGDTDVDFDSFEGLIITGVAYPKSEMREDPYVDKMVDVYTGDVRIIITGRVPEGLDPGGHELTARVKFKGCSKTLCYRPDERVVSFLVNVDEPVPGGKVVSEKRKAAVALHAPSGESSLKFRELLKISNFDMLLDRGMGFTILIVFLAGLLTSLTPCVWPVIPAVLLFIGVHPHKRFWENLLLAMALAAGLILVYSVLGIIAVAFGKNLGFLFQHRWFLAIVVVFFIVMSLSMFGVFHFRLPHRWQQTMHSLGGEGYLGAFLAGLGLGLVASPCAGPVLAALLGYVALQQSYLMGFALLIVYSMGFTLLFILLGACYGELASKLRGGRWMIWIRRTLGVVLLFPAVFYIGSFFDWNGLASIDKPRVEWLAVQEDALRFASRSNMPVMIEFTAEWCPPCRVLDNSFFKRDDIVRLSYHLVPLKVDATVESEEVRSMMERYKIMGMPVVIFLDPQGKPYGDLRVSDYDPKKIEESMRGAIRRAKEK